MWLSRAVLPLYLFTGCVEGGMFPRRQCQIFRPERVTCLMFTLGLFSCLYWTSYSFIQCVNNSYETKDRAIGSSIMTAHRHGVYSRELQVLCNVEDYAFPSTMSCCRSEGKCNSWVSKQQLNIYFCIRIQINKENWIGSQHFFVRHKIKCFQI